MVVPLIGDTLSSTIFSELIKTVIAQAGVAYKCREECVKLEEFLNLIRPEVEGIERRLSLMRKRNPGHDDVAVVQRWLDKLTGVMEKAKEEVRQCNNSKWSYHLRLSKSLTSSYKDIKTAAAHRHTLYLQLGCDPGRENDGTQSLDEGSVHSSDTPEVCIDNWWLPSPKTPVEMNAREDIENRRPEHHNRPSNNGAFHHNGHNPSTSSQPNHHHFPAGMYQNGVPQHEEFLTWLQYPSMFTNAATDHGDHHPGDHAATHHGGHSPGHHATSDFIRW